MANGVTNNIGFNHRTGRERIRHFTWLMGEMEKRITIPKELFQKCAVCGLDWGMCTHAGNNPVFVDNEAMRMIYEKANVSGPAYQACWADFWCACKDIYRIDQ